jgi:phospholipase/carboxylesterase
MWYFTNDLAPEFIILAPRGPFTVQNGGYSWREFKPGTFGRVFLDELKPSVDALLEFVDGWAGLVGLNVGMFDLMGFSQGAALSYAMTLVNPERVRCLAALAGFIPDGGEALINPKSLSGKPIFISHGRLDDLISVEKARMAARLLGRAGAQITYCESDAAHKVSKECVTGLQAFWEDH